MLAPETRRTACANSRARLPEGSRTELISKDIPRGRARRVLFDFDGTISLIRQGWQQVMIPMLTDLLAKAPQAGTRVECERVITDMVTRTTGAQTIYQMIEFCKEVRRCGGAPGEPLAYKQKYLDRLHERIRDRREGLRSGSVGPEQMLVRGAAELLKSLRDRGLTLYCASGTDAPFVEEEAKLLGVFDYFDGGVFGARDDYRNFSKRMLIDKIIADHRLQGDELLTFGDGFVEIEETKAVGGVAVGVASDEERREGIDDWKRARLIEAGADIIIPDFREGQALLGFLLG